MGCASSREASSTDGAQLETDSDGDTSSTRTLPSTASQTESKHSKAVKALVAFEKKQLQRVSKFAAAEGLTDAEKEQLVVIETKRTYRSQLCLESSASHLEHYSEVTFGIPDDDEYFSPPLSVKVDGEILTGDLRDSSLRRESTAASPPPILRSPTAPFHSEDSLVTPVARKAPLFPHSLNGVGSPNEGFSSRQQVQFPLASFGQSVPREAAPPLPLWNARASAKQRLDECDLPNCPPSGGDAFGDEAGDARLGVIEHWTSDPRELSTSSCNGKHNESIMLDFSTNSLSNHVQMPKCFFEAQQRAANCDECPSTLMSFSNGMTTFMNHVAGLNGAIDDNAGLATNNTKGDIIMNTSPMKRRVKFQSK